MSRKTDDRCRTKAICLAGDTLSLPLFSCHNASSLAETWLIINAIAERHKQMFQTSPFYHAVLLLVLILLVESRLILDVTPSRNHLPQTAQFCFSPQSN